MLASLADQLSDILQCEVFKHSSGDLQFELDGFAISLHMPMPANYMEEQAVYMHVGFGFVTPGRTLRIYRLILESNLTVYAQDQAQIGVNPEDDNIVLVARIPLDAELDGHWLAELARHYVEHGRYWRNTLMECNDDMFEDLCTGHFLWIRV